MSYYKSKNSEDQINEAIQNLRREISKEYSKKENGNSEYKANKEQLRTQSFSTLKVKLNLKDKVFHSSQRRYELTQLARKIDELRQRNEDLISANPRVQLSETIRNSLAQFSSHEVSIAVFAIEQLLQEPDRMSIPDYTNRADFNSELYRTNVGIRKLDKALAISAKDLQLRSANISEQFDTNYNKCIYSDDILTKASTRFGENSQAVSTLRSIHNEIVANMISASSQVPILQSEVLEQLDRCGINTGLDTGLQTFWKGFKEKAKKFFNRVFHKNESKSLPESTHTDTHVTKKDETVEMPTQKETFFAELQNFTPITQEPQQPKTELDDKTLTSNDGQEPADD